ncbi:hypothetical protein HNQ03_003204 [Chryseobacterium sp. 16F]|uniref:Uncharacterized protein n=1 Tax=Frigoriflavimonas asaccharolytica TaxID=2735899 RepID=A0A8J8GA02_9FLAO|nr:hypothetical protein [Frigoriflavimonas asaccharolytica]
MLEDSKATCPIGGPDCITIINHGQIAEISPQNVENANKEVLAELFPFVDLGEDEEENKHKVNFKIR